MTLPARRMAALLVLVAIGACSPSFKLTDFPSPVGLYEASLAQYRQGHWENAVTGFERLTLDLPARDSLLPLSHYYLGMAHVRRGDDLLAAQSLVRLVETFPSDTLSDDALYEAARSYQRLWRKPELDPQYGLAAIQAYETLLTAYPSSTLTEKAREEIGALNDMLAQKDFETGEYYFRRRAYDSAIIYFQDVAEQYPDTPTARRAQLRLRETYRKLNYREEGADVCRALRARYPDDAEVRSACRDVPMTPPPDSTAPSAPTPPPAGTSARPPTR